MKTLSTAEFLKAKRFLSQVILHPLLILAELLNPLFNLGHILLKNEMCRLVRDEKRSMARKEVKPNQETIRRSKQTKRSLMRRNKHNDVVRWQKNYWAIAHLGGPNFRKLIEVDQFSRFSKCTQVSKAEILLTGASSRAKKSCANLAPLETIQIFKHFLDIASTLLWTQSSFQLSTE